MLNGPLGTGSDLLQTRSDQAWTVAAWEVAEAVQQELKCLHPGQEVAPLEIGSDLAGTGSGLVWGWGQTVHTLWRKRGAGSNFPFQEEAET